MTLQEIEEQIERLERGEIGEPNCHPAYGTRTFETDAQEACSRLHALWGDLRRILWSGPYQAWARELQGRCRVAIERISAEQGFLPVGVPPRFPAFTDSGGNFHSAVD